GGPGDCPVVAGSQGATAEPAREGGAVRAPLGAPGERADRAVARTALGTPQLERGSHAAAVPSAAGYRALDRDGDSRRLAQPVAEASAAGGGRGHRGAGTAHGEQPVAADETRHQRRLAVFHGTLLAACGQQGTSRRRLVAATRHRARELVGPYVAPRGPVEVAVGDQRAAQEVETLGGRGIACVDQWRARQQAIVAIPH